MIPPHKEVAYPGKRLYLLKNCKTHFPNRYTCAEFVLDSTLSTSSAQFSRSVVSDSLRPHGLQHTRPPCPSPTPKVYPNSCPLSQWCHRTNSSSVVPFSHLQSLPASGSFEMNQFLHKDQEKFHRRHIKFIIWFSTRHYALWGHVLSCFNCVRPSATLWTVACQAPLSMGFSRHEPTGVGCHALLQGNLSNPGMEPASLTSSALASRFFITCATWETHNLFPLLNRAGHLITHECI